MQTWQIMDDDFSHYAWLIEILFLLYRPKNFCREHFCVQGMLTFTYGIGVMSSVKHLVYESMLKLTSNRDRFPDDCL